MRVELGNKLGGNDHRRAFVRDMKGGNRQGRVNGSATYSYLPRREGRGRDDFGSEGAYVFRFVPKPISAGRTARGPKGATYNRYDLKSIANDDLARCNQEKRRCSSP
jgi:hypothetical protein